MTGFDCTRSSPFQLHLRLHLLHPKPRVHVPRYLHESTLSYLRCLLKKSVACFLGSLVVESPQPLSFQILSLTDFFCPFFWDFNCYEIFWSCVRCILFFFQETLDQLVHKLHLILRCLESIQWYQSLSPL